MIAGARQAQPADEGDRPVGERFVERVAQPLAEGRFALHLIPLSQQALGELHQAVHIGEIAD